VALDASLIAWLIKSHAVNEVSLNIGTLFLVTLFSFGIAYSVKSILRNIKKLKDL